jgi:hypothetical protein
MELAAVAGIAGVRRADQPVEGIWPPSAFKTPSQAPFRQMAIRIGTEETKRNRR